MAFKKSVFFHHQYFNVFVTHFLINLMYNSDKHWLRFFDHYYLRRCVYFSGKLNICKILFELKFRPIPRHRKSNLVTYEV